MKPSLEAYRLPADERTERFRAAEQQRDAVSALDFAELVDWSPEEVWGAAT